MKYILSFLILAMTVGISIARETLDILGVDTNFLLLALIAVVTAGLLAHRKLLLIVLVVGLSLTANLPADVLLQYGVDKQILLAALIAVAIIPSVSRYLH